MKPVNSDKILTKTHSDYGSPMTVKPSVLIPPIEAKTPDLFESEHGTTKTPALRRSLGVQQDLDVSWCSDMATPQNPNRHPCPNPPDVTPDIGIRKITDSCNLANKFTGHALAAQVTSSKQADSPLLFDDIPVMRQDNLYLASNQAVDNIDFTSMFKRRNSSFIYPEPVKIQITPQKPKEFSVDSKKVETINASKFVTESSPVLPSQRRRKHPKEVRKSLKFASNASENSFENSSATDNSYSFGQEEDVFEAETGSEIHFNTFTSENLSANKFPANEKIHSDCLAKGNEIPPKNQLLAESATASGKNVTVSSESLTRAKALLEEVAKLSANHLTIDDPESSESLKFHDNVSQILPRSGELKSNQQILETIGFSTAGGKILSISDEALKQARQRFDDLEEDYEVPPALQSKSKIGQLPNGQFDKKNESKQNSLQEITSPFVGFNTAGGKKLSISTEAIQRAQKLFEAIDNVNTIINPESPSSKQASPRKNIPQGFQTASGRSVKISNDALLRAKKMYEETKEEIQVADPSSKNIGMQLEVDFQSASCKNIVLSDDALRKTRACFDDVVSETAEYLACSVPSSRKVTESKAALNCARNSFANTDSDVHQKAHVPEFYKNVMQDAGRKYPAVSGFSTAGGKKVIVSETALARAKKLFEETDEDANRGVCNDGYKTGGALNTSNTIVGSNKSFGTSGFSTVGGKSVTITANSLARAQKLFEEADQSVEHTNTDDCSKRASSPKPRNDIFEVHRNSGISGFSTAGGKQVVISEKALAGAKKLFDNENAALIAVVERASSLETRSESTSSRVSTTEDASSRKRKIDEETLSEEEEAWVSSPTIGKKRKKNFSSPLPLTPLSGTPLSAFDNAPTCVSTKVLVLRRKAREQQKSMIELKRAKKVRITPKFGRKYENKSMPRSTIKQLAKQLPKPYQPYELLETFGVLPSVCLVTAANASSFNFFAWEHFSIEECRNNAYGFQLGHFNVILSDDNIIGCDEIASSLLASENVDPNLINIEWIRNHYRWIVWKLAYMELRVPELFARHSLTPFNILEQLKYRYDVEVDNCKRSALKRIIEQDDTAAKTMVLCVAQIRSNTVLELTDGWYGIDAHCDPALSQLVEKGKIFVGVKLLISGAELVAPGPSTPLEKGSDTYLKISANSTRRAKWDLKLGFFARPQPFPITLKSVLSEGGLVSHTKVIIARTYPVVYMEKAADGKTVFHSERHYRKMSEGMASKYETMMEQVVEAIEREEEEQDRKRLRSGGNRYQNLTDEEKRIKIHAEARKRIEKNMSNMKTKQAVPLLKLRVIDSTLRDLNSAIVSVWRPSEELQGYLKEGRCYRLYNVNAGGLRFGELQLNSLKHTVWKEIKNENVTMPENLPRTTTPFGVACQPSFKPTFNELDLVGLVVYVGEQQTKGPFQTIVLSDGSQLFGIKCWSSLEEYSLTDIVKAGTFLAFSNLQWRTTASRSTSRLPFAFIYEGTVVSSRPALKHLAVALEELKKNVNDISTCISEAEEQVAQLIGNTTPQSATSRFGSDLRRGAFTPTGTSAADVGKDTPTSTNLTIARARLLEKYGNPPALSPLNNIPSPHVRQKFKPPARKSLA